MNEIITQITNENINVKKWLTSSARPILIFSISLECWNHYLMLFCKNNNNQNREMNRSIHKMLIRVVFPLLFISTFIVHKSYAHTL